MKIVLVSQYYWPETFGAGKWTAEVAEWLARRGHDVAVVTAFPNYPEGEVHPEYRGRMLQEERHNGVRIIRTWIYATRRTTNIWQRVLGQVSFSCSLLMATMTLRSPDVIWCASPPLPGAMTAWLMARLNRARYVLFLSDLEPERSIAIGLFTNRYLIAMLRAMERFAYCHADLVCVLSQSTRRWLAKKGVPIEKVKVTPLWADGNQIVPMARDASLRSELSLNGELVALYSGNMGYTMADLETVVDVARQLADKSEIRFVLAGDGVRRESVMKRAEGLPNVLFLPIQPTERYPHLLATADVGLVLLSREGTMASVPSKTYSLLAAGKPIVAMCEADSDTARLLQEASCGTFVPPGDGKRLSDALLQYCKDPARIRDEGHSAREYFERNHSAEPCMKIFEATLAEIACRK